MQSSAALPESPTPATAKVKLKAEFQGCNCDTYRPRAIVASKREVIWPSSLLVAVLILDHEHEHEQELLSTS